MEQIITREMVLEDIQFVKEIDEQTQKVYLGDKWNSFSEQEKEELLVSRESEFKSNCETGFSFVALKNNKIVGFLLAYLLFTKEIRVRHIAVHPNFQKQGIGKKLYDALINKARNQCKKEIGADINPNNLHSLKLHTQVGFQVIDWKKATFKI